MSRKLTGVIDLEGSDHAAYMGRCDEFESIVAFVDQVLREYEEGFTPRKVLLQRATQSFYRVCICKRAPSEDWDYHFEEYKQKGRGRFLAYRTDTL